MTDQQTNSGTPGDDASGNTGTRSFVAARSAQMAQQQPAPGEQPPVQQQQPQQQSPAGERMVRIGEHERSEQAWNELAARDAEQQVRRQALPQSPDGYQVTLPSDFQMPAGVPPGTRFEFDVNSPELEQSPMLRACLKKVFLNCSVTLPRTRSASR
jgi:hypothetical protein